MTCAGQGSWGCWSCSPSRSRTPRSRSRCRPLASISTTTAHGAKEPLLAPLLDANGGSFDVTVPVPGYVPPGGAVGIILNNYSSANDTLSIYATGDIRINGKLKMRNVESVDLENEQDMSVGVGASMTFGGGRCCLSDFTWV